MPRKAAFGVGWWRILLEYLRRHQRAQWCHDAKTFPLQPRLQCWTRRPDQTTKNIYATCVNTINVEERGRKGKSESRFTIPARWATPALHSTNGTAAGKSSFRRRGFEWPLELRPNGISFILSTRILYACVYARAGILCCVYFRYLPTLNSQ